MGFSRQERWSGLPLPSPISSFPQSLSLSHPCFIIWKDVYNSYVCMDSIQACSLSTFDFSLPSDENLNLWLSYRKLSFEFKTLNIFLFPPCPFLKTKINRFLFIGNKWEKYIILENGENILYWKMMVWVLISDLLLSGQ